jgi:hypothetical protein
MKVKRILSSLLALQRLEDLAEQAYKVARHRDEVTLLALKTEIDEQVARLCNGGALREADGAGVSARSQRGGGGDALAGHVDNVCNIA